MATPWVADLSVSISAKLLPAADEAKRIPLRRSVLARRLFELAERAQAGGWSAEELLRAETQRRERQLRKAETQRAKT